MRCDVYDITKLSIEERETLARRIFPVIEAIASCETIEDFIAEYNAPCWAMSMAVYSDEERVVAYARYKIADLSLEQINYKIVRLDVSIHPQYKGRIPYARFYFRESWRLRAILREKNLYALCLCLSPVPYYYIAKYYQAVYPLPDTTDPHQESLLGRFLLAEGLRLLPQRAYAIKLLSRGFIETPEERQRWAEHPSPYVAFYREQCPHYADGEALVAIAHLTAPRLLRGLFRMLFDRLRRSISRRFA